jgi:hypothetical protein
MNVILKVILAVYKFFVGDLVILIGTVLTMVILALINSVGALAPLRGGSGLILIVGVLAVLLATLSREIERPENRQKVYHLYLFWIMQNRVCLCMLSTSAFVSSLTSVSARRASRRKDHNYGI